MLEQIQLINYILNSKDYSIIAENNLTKELFPQLMGEFSFIVNHYNKYNKIPDLETFLKVFPTFEVLEVNESVEYLINELHRKKADSYLADNFNKVKKLIESKKTEEALDLVANISSDVLKTKKLEAIDILNDISRYDTYIDKTRDFSKYYVTTGFKELDESLGGGIDRRNAYFVVSARAGYGKTLVLVKMAAAAASKGLKVGFYEGEMTVEKIGNRLDTILSHISNSSINHGRIEVANEYRMFLDNLKDNHNGNLYILTRDMVPDNRMTVNVLRSFVDKYDLDILFVDQISLLDDSHYAKQTFDQAANISKDLKNLQVQKHIPIVIASQQNRASIEEGKYAGTQNLSLSDRIGQDATDVIFLSKEDDIMTFNIAKARDGCKQNVLSYAVDFNLCTWTYVPQENDKLVDYVSSVNSTNETFTPSIEYYEDDDFGESPF